MRFEGAIIREQGIVFAIVVVKRHILDNTAEANRVARSFQPAFPGMPVVLMAQTHRGAATYFGRPDIARFLARVPLSAIPWREYILK
ncbi:hypothetical protein [Brevundimonas sp. PAMC22021]|uniref:hypothetical protein n=1 Tax=Brevundimonas sp. PAMC22021 TaxID=2861285 RepID=UPI001C62913D|nr:hypothetical protein [Brevundimonas sp. PAMC22021]QYF86583.1 hypothetical protein KY493_12270 [Brevundimonas sp. PAMC22021]